MKTLRRIAVLLAFSLYFAPSAFASDTLLKHVRAVSQTMSALYMTSLSEGGAKYQRDQERYTKIAVETLQQYAKEDGEQSAELLKAWEAFSSKLSAVYALGYGWQVDAYASRDFRTYLSDVYSLAYEQAKDSKNKQTRLLLAAAQMEAMSARFFDIAAAYNGANSLSIQDADKVPSKAMTKAFKGTLLNIASSSDKKVAKSLLAAKSKWEFVEESVVNYSDASAYFLVYATKSGINKVLTKTQRLLATK